MFRKVLIAIIVLMFFAALWIKFSEAVPPQESTVTAQVVTPPYDQSTPQTTLQLFPNPALPDSEGDIEVAVSMNTHHNAVTFVQFTLQYDPSALTFKEIEPDDAFYNARVITKNIDEAKGIITYGLQLPAQQMDEPVQGNDHIAELEFIARQQRESTVKFVSAQVKGPEVSGSILQQTKDTVVKTQW